MAQTPIHEYQVQVFDKKGATCTKLPLLYVREDAEQALAISIRKWQNTIGGNLKFLKIEKVFKYSDKWVDESEVLTDANRFVTKGYAR